MRCSCCNRNLNDYELTLRSTVTGDFLDTCMSCLDGLDIDTHGREDLNPFDYTGDDEETDENDDE